MRDLGLQDDVPPSSSSTARLRQQTLTQFAASNMHDNEVYLSSDSEADLYIKENDMSTKAGDAATQDPEAESDDEAPVTRVRKRNSRLTQGSSKDKRRRTLDVEASNRRSANQKSNTGSSPSDRVIVADSDDEDGLDEDPPEDFLQWLGDGSSREDSPANISTKVTASQAETEDDSDEAPKQREDSVIPQTPVKNIRFQLPDSASLETPSTARIARYGPPGSTQSPSKLSKVSTPTRHTDSLIQDSYATEGWSSPLAATPVSSKSERLAFTTPIGVASPSPEIRRKIPAAMLRQEPTSELTEQSSQSEAAANSAVNPTIYEIPDSDAEDGYSDYDYTEPTAVEQAQSREHEDAFETGNETQLILNQLATSTSQWAPSSTKSGTLPSQAPSSPSNTPFSSAREQQPPRRLRRPITYPFQGTQGIPLESQRVAVSILHTFAPTSPRSDILLPLADDNFTSLLDGYTLSISLPFKIPDSVSRAWLFNSKTTRYVADISTRPADPNETGTWIYGVNQVYELNNPTSESDMRAEEWIHGQIGRYVYFPPAVVSQLLYNLRHPVFDTEDPQSSNAATPRPTSPAVAETTAGQREEEAEVIQSTPDDITPPHVVMPPPANLLPNSSQASTASQLSTLDVLTCPEPEQSIPAQETGHSSDSVRFLDDASSVAIPFSMTGSSMPIDASYQLLTKSQMLPDSLLRDDHTMPDEIWDSDDSGN